MSGAKGDRPRPIVEAAPAKDHAGFGRIHPKDRNDAGDRADQQGRGVAEASVDPLGDTDLVGGCRTSSWDLVPGQHLGAITRTWSQRSTSIALDRGAGIRAAIGRQNDGRPVC